MEPEQLLAVADAVILAQKGRHLSDLEITILRGAIAGQTYEAIAERSGYSVSHVKRHIGPQLWQLLSQGLNEAVSKTNFRTALIRRAMQTEAGVQQSGAIVPQPAKPAAADRKPPLLSQPDRSPARAPQIDWGEAVSTAGFWGRTAELATLADWIVEERCRVVAVVGIGGIGKTALAAKLAREIQHEFEFVIWRSLRNAPPLETLLADLVSFLSNQQDIKAEVGGLFHWLRSRRCLVVLDNLETIFQAGDRAGQYRPGYEAYGELFKLLSEGQHQSCVLLTSREKPAEIAAMEGTEAVRSLQLQGSSATAQALIAAKGLVGSEADKRTLAEQYSWNPLAIKIVTSSIQEIFDGNIKQFLQQNTILFNGARRLLDQQFKRLSALEQSIMYWLAINRDWTTIAELVEDMTPSPSRIQLLEALESLSWRSLIERRRGSYTQQPVVMEYCTNILSEQISNELANQEIQTLGSYALLKTTTKEYIREAQKRLILTSIATHLQTKLETPERIEAQLQDILKLLQSGSISPKYAAGNIINLCCCLQIDLTGYDFSKLTLYHAHLSAVSLHGVNFANSKFIHSTFTHTLGGIVAVAFSPDSRLLALADTDSTIRLWQTTSGHESGVEQILSSLSGHRGWILAVAWHPDQHTLVSSSSDGTIKIWDVETGECLQTLGGHKPSRSLAWSPDGRTFASSGDDGTIRIWDAETGDCLCTLHGHQSLVWSVAWHPNEKILASGSDDQTIRLWNSETGQCLETWTVTGYQVGCVAWSPDGKMLASVSADDLIRLWDRQTGQPLRSLVGHTRWIYSLAWSPDGTMLASCSGDRTVRLWNPISGSCLRTLQGHQEPIWSVSWSSDGNAIASGSLDQMVRLWNPQTGQCRHTLRGYTNAIRTVAWSPDGKFLTSPSIDNTVRVWEVETGQCLKTLTGHQGWVLSAAWNPLSRPVDHVQGAAGLLASSGRDMTVKIWDVQTGRCLRTFLGHQSWVWSVSWSPVAIDLPTGVGQLLATASSMNDKTVRVWNLEGECLKVLSGHQSWVWRVIWSPDGKTLASASADQRIKLWDVQTGECLQTLHDDRLVGVTIAWSPDGNWLATSSMDRTVRLWNLQTGAFERELVGHQTLIWALAWSPNGNWLASGSDDGTIKFWNLETHECKFTLRGHQSQVCYVTWSPRGDVLASSSLDGTIRLWNVQTGNCFKTLRADRPYEGTNITGVTGITKAQKASLKALGAVESAV